MNQFKPKSLIPLFGILVVFFILRFQNIQSIPVFGDEAIYLRWSQLIKNVDTLRFVPVSDGKQPLFMWLTAISYKLFADPLVAGRIISLFSGAGIIALIYFFCLLFLNQTVAVFAGIIYLFLPFSFFFDRLASADNLLSFFGITSLFFAFLLAKYPRLDLSLILGFFLGLAWLTKSPAIFFIGLTFISFILLTNFNLKKIYFPLISSAIAFAIYNILRLGPQFHQIALRNRDYVWTLTDIFHHPLDPLIPHLKDIFTIYSQYISLPIIIAFIGLIYFFKIKKNRSLIFIISLWWILPLITNATIAKVFTARYILFTLPPLIILLAIGLSSFYQLFNKKFLPILIICLCFLPNLYLICRLSISPFTVNLPSTESGYLSDWTSGWGIKEAANYLVTRSHVANVIVGTEGYFGTLPDGLQIYTDSLPQLTVFGVGIDIVKIPEKLIDARDHGDEVYLLFNQSRLKLTPDDYQKLTLINSYAKPKQDKLLLYRLN